MTPEQARWTRDAPRRESPPGVLKRTVAAAFPGARVMQAELLAPEMRNANFRLRLEAQSEEGAGVIPEQARRALAAHWRESRPDGLEWWQQPSRGPGCSARSCWRPKCATPISGCGPRRNPRKELE